MALQYTHNRTLCQGSWHTVVPTVKTWTVREYCFIITQKYTNCRKLNWSFCPSPSSLTETLCPKVKKKKKQKDKFTFHLFHYFDFHCSEIGPMPRWSTARGSPLIRSCETWSSDMIKWSLFVFVSNQLCLPRRYWAPFSLRDIPYLTVHKKKE